MGLGISSLRLGLHARGNNWIGQQVAALTALDGTTPAAIADFENWRFAIPKLGPELAPNGTFDTDSGWTKGTGWAISGGAANKTAGSASNLTAQGVAPVNGSVYLLSITVSNYSAGAIQPNVGGSVTPSMSANGTYVFSVTASSGGSFYIYGNPTFAGSVDNVSLRAIVFDTLQECSFDDFFAFTGTPVQDYSTGSRRLYLAGTETPRLSPYLEAIVQRTTATEAVWTTSQESATGTILGGSASVKRVIGVDSNTVRATQTANLDVDLGSGSVTGEMVSGIAWDGSGRRIFANGASASDTNQPGSRTMSYLGRASNVSSDFGIGLYKRYVIYPTMLSQASVEAFDAEWYEAAAALDVDFANSRAYWGGEEQAFGDLTAIGDGSYTLAYSTTGSWWTGDCSVVIDYVVSDVTDESTAGVLFGWHNDNSNYVRAEMWNVSGSDNRTWTRIFMMPNDVVGQSVRASQETPGQSTLPEGKGLQRAIFSVPSGGISRGMANNMIAYDATSNNGSIIAPTTLHFLRHPVSGTKIVGVDVRRVTVYPYAMSEGQMDTAGKRGVNYPIHFLGDSFLTSHLLKEDVMLLTLDGGYIGYSQDGVGSTTLAQQATRFALYPKWWNSTLVIMDGSLELDGTAAIAAISDMVGNLTHDRWLYVQSNPINPLGDSRRDDWIVYDAAIEAYCGAGHYVATLDAMYAESDGGLDDTADVADGLWPRSLRDDSTHVNTAGRAVLAGLIHDALVANGWA